MERERYIKDSKSRVWANLVVVFIVFISAGVLFAQTTDDKVDRNLRSQSRVNPSTLAMEFSIPLGSYPGRGGNLVPFALNYSSKVWTTKYVGSSKFTSYINEPIYKFEVVRASNILANFAAKSVAGWTSSLQSPLILIDTDLYNQNGEPFTFSNLPGGSSSITGGNCNITGYGATRVNTSCGSGRSAEAYVECCDNFNICWGTTEDHCLAPGADNYPIQGQPGNQIPIPPEPSPTPEVLHMVKRLKVQTPDGASHELRKDDETHNCQTSPSDCTSMDQNTGTYLTVDGSGIRLERGEIEEGGVTKDVLHMPDGGRYIFVPTSSGSSTGESYFPVERYIDRNGNKTTYASTNQKWIDTSGREMQDPLLNPLSFPRPVVGPQTFNLKGLNNQEMPYAIDWKKLADVLDASTPTLKYPGADTCETGIDDPVSPSLWENAPAVNDDDSVNTRYINKQRVCAFNFIPFNPVVMSELALPNDQKYQFKYNEYGEITKIVHPTGGYERFEYDRIPPVGSAFDLVYHQTNRGVRKRYVSYDGNTEQIAGEYSVRIGSGTFSYYTVVSEAPDDSREERDLYWSEDSRFGFDDPRSGMVNESRAYDINGVLRSRTLTDWIMAGPRIGGDPRATRDPRPGKSMSIIFEPGSNSALATLSETEYDDAGSTDPTDFSHLNVKRKKGYHYAVIQDKTTVDNEQLSWTTIESWFPASKLASVSETDYSYDPNYKARGIIGLPVETRVLNPANPSDVLAKSQLVYDETAYFDNSYTTTGWVDPLSSLRGNATTARTWVKETDTWLETHTMFDNFGNVRKVWDASNDPSKFAETQYDPLYKYAYPTKVIAPAPDPSGITGTNQTSTAETTYDFTTGLPLSVKDDFGQITRTEYDGSLRPVRVFADNFTAPESQTVYGVPNSSGQLPPDQRFVKVRKQIDATNWDEATTWFDGLGRTIKTQAKDSQGDVFGETKYDAFGRVERVTNPYRLGDTVYWSKTRYDAAGRAVESYAPAELANLGSAASLGVTSFDISNVPNFVGTVVTSTDASGRKGRSITNALGQLLRVDEPTAIGGTADADLGTLASPLQPTFYKYDLFGKMVEVTQGVQKRHFKYDSLGRLLRVRQPEQETNAALAMADTYNTSGQWTAGFTYDILGNVLTATDANGVTISNTYDRAGRVKTRTYSGETGLATAPVSFYYDGKGLVSQQTPNYAKGKLTKVTSTVSETRYTQFDNFGRLTQSQQITDGQTYTSSYQYNLSGALVQETYPSGRVVKNEFESDGDLLRVYGKANATATEQTYVNSFSFTASGGISQMRLGNGKWETAKFNSRLQMTELGLGNSATDAGLWKVAYEYGELNTDGTVNSVKNTGNIAKQTLTIPGTNFVQSYKYDSLYRLTEAKETTGTNQNWIQNWSYDKYGNRLSFSQNINNVVQNTTPTIDPNTNRFVTTGQNFQYDLNGNLTRDGEGRQFIFNGDNKQTVVRDAANNIIGRYFYDGEGKRVKKVTNSETTVFVYSSGKLVAEYSTQLSQNPTISYTTTDHLGSPRVITDALGQVESRRDFMPFGEDLFNGIGARSESLKYGTNADDVKQKFTGYLKDSETGLDFAEARMYENRHGRFTAVDPLLASGKSAIPQSFNRYTYVGNNPLFFVDKNGLIWGRADDGRVRWFAKKLGTGFTSFTPDNWQYTGKDNRTVQLDANSSKWSHIDPVQSVAESNPSLDLVMGFNQGIEDVKSGSAKGVANTFIDTANGLTDMALNIRGGVYAPNPFQDNPLAIERYSYDSLTQAKWGTAIQFGLTVAPSFAAAPFATGSSLSVVPETQVFRFSQNFVRSDGMFHAKGDFAGQSIMSVADDLVSGAKTVGDVPVGYVTRNGINLIDNTRSSLALQEAGIPMNQWNLVNRTGQRFFENSVNNKLANNGLSNTGTNTVRFNRCIYFCQ